MIAQPNRRRRPMVVVAVIGVVLALIIGGAVAFYVKSRSDAVKEFKRDLVAAGFSAPDTKSGWKDERKCVKKDKKKGTCTEYKTVSELDAPSKVASCPITMEREDHPKKGPRGVKLYKFDEVNWGNNPDGIDVTDPAAVPETFTTENPTREQIYDYLERNKATFACFKANAAKN